LVRNLSFFWLRHKLHAFAAGGREKCSLNLVYLARPFFAVFLPFLAAHKSLGLQLAMHNILIAATVTVSVSVSLRLKSIS